MLQKTRGIVLNYIKYKETSVIVKIYTEVFGLQSFIINGIRSKASKKSLALFQPLTLLDLVIYSKNNENKPEGIRRMSEFKTSLTFQSIPFDMKKTAMAIFITEIISKSLKEVHVEESNVFSFLYSGVVYLDGATKGFENFHIQLLTQLTNYIGFGIFKEDDLKSLENELLGLEDLDNLSRKIIQLAKGAFGSEITLTNEQRKAILNIILTYYTIHIEGFGNIKSKPILNQLFL